MTVVTSTLQIDLVEDVTTDAPRVAAALEKTQKQVQALEAALAKSGLSDRLQGSLKRLGASAAHVEGLTRAWQSYEKEQGLVGKAASQRTKAEIAGIKNWENVGTAAIRAMMSEEKALARLRTQQAEEAVRTAEREAQGRIRAMERETQAARQAAHQRQEDIRRGGVAHYAAGAVAGAVSAHAVASAAEKGIEKGAELQHNRVQMQQAGIDADLRAQIEARALQLSAKYANVSQTAVMELAKEARSVLNSPEEMLKVLDPLTAAKSVLDAQDRTGEASHGLGLLVKGAENIGAGKDPERLATLIDGYVRAMQVMGRSINPEEVFAFDKNARTAGAELSDRFLMTTALSLSQEMNGASAGKAVNQLRKQLVGGLAHETVPVRELVNLGLIDRKSVDYNKVGEVKGVKQGVLHAVKGDSLLEHDPDLWVYKYLLPALEKHGITKQEDQLAVVSKIFPGTQAADLVSKLIMQRSSYEAHGRYYEDAAGLKGAELNKQDAFAGLEAVTKALGNLEAQATSPAMATVGKTLYDIADGLNYLAEKAKDHPLLAMTGAAVATAGGLGASGYLAYQVMNGFGLGKSATALDHSALMLEEAAAKLGAVKGVVPGEPAAAAPEAGVPKSGFFGEGGVAGAVKGISSGLVGWLTYELGRAAIDAALAALPKPKYPDGYDPQAQMDRGITGDVGALLSGKRAAGGPVGRGLSYLVGERGPEIFTPGATGAITSTDRLTKALAGGGASEAGAHEIAAAIRQRDAAGLDGTAAVTLQRAVARGVTDGMLSYAMLHPAGPETGDGSGGGGNPGDGSASPGHAGGDGRGRPGRGSPRAAGGAPNVPAIGKRSAVPTFASHLADTADPKAVFGEASGHIGANGLNAFGLGGFNAPMAPVGSNGSEAGNDEPAADIPGALNPRLAGSRKSFFDELDRNPQLRRDVIKTASMENSGSAASMTTVIESMVNRAKMKGYKSLNQAIHDGFYGPVNRGGLRGALSEKNRRDGEAALKAVRDGSNMIGYRTDQGMLTDPGARRYMREPDKSGWKKIRGENYFYMGPQGRRWAKEQEEADRAAALKNADQPAAQPTDDPLKLRKAAPSDAHRDLTGEVGAMNDMAVSPDFDHDGIRRYTHAIRTARAELEALHATRPGAGGAPTSHIAGLGSRLRGGFAHAGSDFG